MASLRLHSDRLEIRLTPAERALSFGAPDLTVARSDIRGVTLTDDPWVWLRGIRAPGTAIPLVLAVGTWRYHGGRDLVIVKRRRPTAVIDIEPGHDEVGYSRIIVSTGRGTELIESLGLAPYQAE